MGDHITADEFTRSYANRSGTTAAELHAAGRIVKPCGCGEEGCRGWQMVNATGYDLDRGAWLRGEGPDPSHGADPQ